MKNVLFISMALALILARNESASAQRGFVQSVTSSSDQVTPVAGDSITLITAYAGGDNAELGYKKGDKFCVLNVYSGKEWAAVIKGATCDKLGFTKYRHQITSVQNPKNAALQQGDKAGANAQHRTVTFTRGNTVLIKIFYEQ